MTYETYETKAFTLSAYGMKEGNFLFNLFTNDLGMVKALAQNVRAEKSKLRYNLQAFSKANVSLVRGKEYWRVVGAKDTEHFFILFKDNPEKIRLLTRVFNLLSRLVHGEGGNAYLFGTFDGMVEELRKAETSSQTLKLLEILVVSRILQALGYFSKPLRYRMLFEDTQFTTELLGIVESFESELLSDINSALRESHL